MFVGVGALTELFGAQLSSVAQWVIPRQSTTS
jgi:hypothetical protein